MYANRQQLYSSTPQQPIMEAKGLMGKEYRTCDSYVKMALVPDTDRSSRQKTKTVPDCRIPVFHELFRFSVKDGDYRKRLLVTVWNHDRNSRKSELLGCMSFGISSLIAHEKVTILRGKDGYGFTICCDSPVRVQAVDPGGPADQAGLQQLDTVLQLNGQPVEQWKCVELAHTIRNSHSEITVSVWRTVPQIKPGFESLIRPSNKCNYNPRSPPSKREKNYSRQPVPSEQRQSCHILYNGTDYSSQPASSEQRQSCNILYNGTDHSRQPVPSEQRQSCHILYNGTDHSSQPVPSEQRQSCHILYNGTDQGSRNGWTQQEQGESKTAHTVQGPHMAASGDQNYILLAPINPGSQILRPVFQENRGTLGRVYRGRAHGGLQRRSTFIGSTTNMSKTPVHTLKNYADYQNCTVVRSHIPHTSYGTYVTLAPKVLIFPVSVQVTVFIYTDLMLLTREDELGRCNVLQNPLFLQHLKLQEDCKPALDDMWTERLPCQSVQCRSPALEMICGLNEFLVSLRSAAVLPVPGPALDMWTERLPCQSVQCRSPALDDMGTERLPCQSVQCRSPALDDMWTERLPCQSAQCRSPSRPRRAQ
ncbi:UNVERIFIED_CONTAM: hypothetical protein FKN15_015946 [Acipenser sinensis]